MADSSDEEAAAKEAGPAVVAAAAGGDASDEECEDGDYDSSDEQDDTAGSVADNIGSARAPEGWKITEEAPQLATELELQQLIGKNILHGWDSKTASGWFIGTVHSSSVPPRDLKATPSANFVVDYTAKLTGKMLSGKVSCELSARTYGPAEWWVVVVKDDSASGSGSAGAKGKGKGKKGKA